MKHTMKELPLSEKPYEKCVSCGEQALSDAELLAVIIRTGTREESAIDLARSVLLSGSSGSILDLLHATIPELMKIKGIGMVKAVQLKCIGELSKRIARASAGRGDMFPTPESIARYQMEALRHCDREKAVIMMFNSKNRLLHETVISAGTVNSSLVSPREIFLEALKYEAVSLCLIHNHPSGDPAPSREDILITRRLKEVGDLIGIILIDHIIIGDTKYVSMKERGIL